MCYLHIHTWKDRQRGRRGERRGRGGERACFHGKCLGGANKCPQPLASWGAHLFVCATPDAHPVPFTPGFS